MLWDSFTVTGDSKARIHSKNYSITFHQLWLLKLFSCLSNCFWNISNGKPLMKSCVWRDVHTRGEFFWLCIVNYLTDSVCDFCRVNNEKFFPTLAGNFFSQCTPVQMKIEQYPQVEICWKEFNLSINFSESVSLSFIHLLLKCSIN